MKSQFWGAVISTAAVLAALGGCRPASGPDAPGAGAVGAESAPRAAISVSTVRAEQRDVPVTLEATGTVTPLTSVEIRPQLSGIVERVHIREGQPVRQGQLLFTLDARSLTAELARVQAQMQKDQAALADAERQLVRSQELYAQNFVSQVAVDQNRTLVETQRAVVAADRAAVQAARVALSNTRIVAPLAGRAGLVPVAAGSVVSPTSSPMVTIAQLDPIAVAFSLPQRHLSEALASLQAGGGRVTAVLPEGRGLMQGHLHVVDNVVDAGTGTVKVKALFDNRKETLWPGAFVGVKLAVQTLKGAVVIPHAAIVQGARGRTVYVVDADGKAAVRPVELVHATGQDAVVTGVRPGERVIVEGRQNVRPGAPVVERSPSAPATPGSGKGGERIAAARP